jgi:hypothetical protein
LTEGGINRNGSPGKTFRERGVQRERHFKRGREMELERWRTRQLTERVRERRTRRRETNLKTNGDLGESRERVGRE